MGADEGDEQNPGGLVIPMCLEPAAGPVCRLRVVLLIGRCPRAGAVDPGTLLAEWRILPDAAQDVAHAVHDVEGIDLLGEADVVLLAAEVELADGIHAMALAPEAVAPARHAAVIGTAVVPVADLVDVATGCQGGPRRYADGTGGVGRREPRAPVGQAVDVGGLDDGVAVAAGEVARVLIGHEKEEVRGLHGYNPFAGSVLVRPGEKAA